MEEADYWGRNLDPGYQTGTVEAREGLRDPKPEPLRQKPATALRHDETGKPWKNFGEMRRAFEQVREQVGETQYLEALALAGVQNPGQFRSASKALECYSYLAGLAAQPEVA